MDTHSLDVTATPTTIVAIVRRYPVLAFVALACVFGWGIFFAAFTGVGSNPANMPLGPVLAALVVTACQGRAELHAWGRRLRRWGAAPKWYLLALLAPAALHLLNVLINHLFGAPLPTSAQLAGWPNLTASFVVFLVLVGIGEEAGWTAFMAPILLRRHGMLGAWVLASAIRIVWHLPMMLDGGLPWVVGTVGNAAFTMVTLQVLTASGGQWTPVAVWHATLNTFGSGFFFAMVTGDDNARLGLLLAGGYTVVATVAYFAGRSSPSRPGSARAMDGLHAARPVQSVHNPAVEGRGASLPGPVLRTTSARVPRRRADG